MEFRFFKTIKLNRLNNFFTTFSGILADAANKFNVSNTNFINVIQQDKTINISTLSTSIACVEKSRLGVFDFSSIFHCHF